MKMIGINAKIKGELSIKSVKYNKSDNTRSMVFSIVNIASNEMVKEWFGEKLSQMIFTDTLFQNETSDETIGPCRIKPMSKFDVHKVSILGKSGQCIPDIAMIKYNEKTNTAELDIRIQIPVVQTLRNLYSELCLSVGNVIEISLEKSQMELADVE